MKVICLASVSLFFTPKIESMISFLISLLWKNKSKNKKTTSTLLFTWQLLSFSSSAKWKLTSSFLSRNSLGFLSYVLNWREIFPKSCNWSWLILQAWEHTSTWFSLTHEISFLVLPGLFSIKLKSWNFFNEFLKYMVYNLTRLQLLTSA